MLSNTYRINTIVIKPIARCFCPLGSDWYTNRFIIEMEVGEFIPDYCKLDKWIVENIEGKVMIVEGAVAALYEYINETYKPKMLIVKSNVTSTTHSEVTVSRY